MGVTVSQTTVTKLLLTAAFLMIAGCSSDREGELVRHYISCEKSQAGKWVSPDRRIFNRLTIVHKSRYQVSFANQRVVASGALKLKKCTVYDVRNWRCNDTDGSPFDVVNGGKTFYSCGRASRFCGLDVNFIKRAIIFIRGVDEAERLCNISSETFDLSRKLGM